ncbi:DUF2946 domain-containing protein [Caballeronia sp. LZ016]|uniref:DUF2946 domain-containing protein n=1 Tax=Caballeronia sp. LZ016 TaxID=3038554 RepID=UPI00285708E7|nr:DUF2946 domain-containing protein [Caballeronia sp. LZ016]MDR5738519.1 DUF2946 domain-containing protein [Caballeronia sp. LZ016]
MQALRRGKIGRVGGIVALCAMLLLSFAPAASQWLNAQRVDAQFASVCASGDSRAEAPSHADDHALTQLEACGYCDFIAHAPTPPAPHVALASLRLPRDSFPAIERAGTMHRVRFDDAQPRAPPALA